MFLIGRRAEPALEDASRRPSIDVARELGVELVVSLGALLADVPHTRPVQITGHRGRPRAGRSGSGFSQTRYEGPTGHRRRPARRVRAGRACCRRASGRRCRTTSRRSRARRRRSRCSGGCEDLLEVPIDIDRARGGGRGVRAPARRGGRERARGRACWSSGSSARSTTRRSPSATCPPGDSIAREFERFLKEQGDEK